MTIVEVLVALLVLTAGLIGTVSAAAGAARLIAQGARHTRLAAASASLLEELRDAGCTVADGARVVRPFRFRWTVRRAPGIAEIHLTASWAVPAGASQAAFVLARWCP